jgi:ABC-type molybdate transport system permease subunit
MLLIFLLFFLFFLFFLHILWMVVLPQRSHPRWIRTVNNGLFKYLVLPPKITGAMLLQLSSQVWCRRAWFCFKIGDQLGDSMDGIGHSVGI